jgi:toxin-antitoxin system PIN domain toxin
MPDLLDASVWLPLSMPDHIHHLRALRYWQEESSEEMAFCRVTALALLRHLTNPRIVGPGALDGAGAWRALKVWLSQPGVKMLGEPSALDEWLERWSTACDPRGGNWTDAYLAAFAAAGGCRLVAFDRDFHRYPGLAFLHLAP